MASGAFKCGYYMNFIRCLTCCQHHELPFPASPFTLSPVTPLSGCPLSCSSSPSASALSTLLRCPQKLHLVLLCLLWASVFGCCCCCCCWLPHLVATLVAASLIFWSLCGLFTQWAQCHAPYSTTEGERESESQVSDTQFKFMPVYNHCLPVIKP